MNSCLERQPKPYRPSVVRAPTGPLHRESAWLAPAIVHDVLREPGQPLEASTQALMGARLGHDFSQVRVHAGARAAESAQSINANAYTVGEHVVFDTGRYAPDTPAGTQLLAHELAHVVQQAGIDPAQMLGLRIRGNDHHEQAAQTAASQVTAGSIVHPPAGAAAVGLQRAEDTGKAQQTEDACARQENDPESFSIMAAKHFLTEVDPAASQLAKTVRCEAATADPQRMECDVTFSDGQTIHVTWIKNLNNVEAQRPAPDGRQWCVYHYVCDPSGEVRYEKKGCSSNVGARPSGAAGPALVGAGAGLSGGAGRG